MQGISSMIGGGLTMASTGGMGGMSGLSSIFSGGSGSNGGFGINPSPYMQTLFDTNPDVMGQAGF